MLESFGATVVGAEDGVQAEALFAESREKGQPFDAVILDLTIPGGIGGADVLKLLRQQDQKIKAIVCSGYASDPLMANYVDHGFQAVLAKPFTLGQLQRTVIELLAAD